MIRKNVIDSIVHGKPFNILYIFTLFLSRTNCYIALTLKETISSSETHQQNTSFIYQFLFQHCQHEAIICGICGVGIPFGFGEGTSPSLRLQSEHLP